MTKLWVTGRTLCRKLKQAQNYGSGERVNQGKLALLGLMEADSADLRLAWDTIPKASQLEAALTAIRIATSVGADGQMAELAEK